MAQNLLQLTILVVWHNYVGYLLVQIIGTVLANWLINRRARKLYPEILRPTTKALDQATRQSLKQNVVGNISSKIGVIVVNGTDNILLSKFIGLGMVGVYANYALIAQGLGSMMTQVMSAVIGSLGNLGVSANVAKQKQVYYETQYLVALMSSVISISFYVVVQGFIELVFGELYVLHPITTGLIALNLGYANLRQANLSFISALGLFWTMRYKALIEAAINLIVSLLLITQTKLGINGVLLGNLVSHLTVNLWWEPLIIWRHGFRTSVRWSVAKFCAYHLFLATGVLIVYAVNEYQSQNNWANLIVTGTVSVVAFVFVFLPFRENRVLNCVIERIARRRMKNDSRK